MHRTRESDQGLSGQVIGVPTLAATDPQLGGEQAPGISGRQLITEVEAGGPAARAGIRPVT